MKNLLNTSSSKEDELPDVMTSLPSGERISKNDIRLDACGTIDELNSFIGLLVAEVPVDKIEELHDIQRMLFSVGAFVVGAELQEPHKFESQLTHLKKLIENYQKVCGFSHSFVLPGGCRPAALAHVCRTICRRAERQIIAIRANDAVPYMNRLSTYFFYFAKYLNYFYNTNEIKL